MTSAAFRCEAPPTPEELIGDFVALKISDNGDGIPPDFPIQSVTLDQDYDFQDIGGRQFVLPLHSDIRSREGKYRAWNEVTFRSYHKYGTESTITFDTGDQPADKLKEEKPKK